MYFNKWCDMKLKEMERDDQSGAWIERPVTDQYVWMTEDEDEEEE